MPQAGLEAIEGRLFTEKSLQFLQYLLAVLGRQRVEGLRESNDRSCKCNQGKQQNFVRFSHVAGARTPFFKNYPIGGVFRRWSELNGIDQVCSCPWFLERRNMETRWSLLRESLLNERFRQQ